MGFYSFDKLSIIRFFLLIVYGIWTCRAVINGNVSPASLTIQQSTTYTFNLNLQNFIAASGYIQIVFPSDYDFSSQATTSETKTCTAISGFGSTSSTEITCSLNKYTNTLLAQLASTTASKTLSFSITSIINPTYAKTTSAMVIQAYNTSSSTPEVSDNSFKVTPTPGAITAVLASDNDIDGSYQRLSVTLTLSHYIPQTGIITILLPKWNPDSTLPKTILSAGAVGCTPNVGFVSSQQIICTFTPDVSSTSTPDQLTITGQFNSATYSISFYVSNFRNPPSLTTYSGISITTSTSTTTNKIDQATNVNLPITQISSLSSTAFTITLGDQQVNKQTSYTFNIRIGLPLPMNSSIKLTFPSTVTPASSGLTVTGQINLNSGITASYDSATRILTLTNLIITSSGYVDEGYYIQFMINLVTNPSNTQTSDSFVYQSYDANGKAIEKTSTGVTITASPGSITSATITPAITTIRASTSYAFTFKVQDAVPIGGIIYIVFPSTILIADRTSTACLSAGTNIDATNAKCTVTSSRYLTISSGFGSAATAAGSSISFTVSSITNYDTTQTSATFLIYTQTSSSITIDSYQLGSLTVACTFGTISGLTITPSSLFTGVQTTYAFQFTITQRILINSYIQISFPTEITISDTTYSAGTCQTVIGLSGGISCSFTSSQVVQLSNGFNTGDFLSGLLQFTISGITNPRSLKPSSSFNVYIYDANGNGQYALTSGLTTTMTTASDFRSISISSGSVNNGAYTNYTFSITLSNVIVSGDYARITIPTEIGLSSPVCTGVSNLATSLTCSLISGVLDIALATSVGSSLSANSLMIFLVQNMRNPTTLTTSSSFQVQTLTSDKAYQINVRTTGLTITNSDRGSITSASIAPDSTALNVSTSYTITFTPTNPLPQNSFIQIGIPSEISVPSGTSTMACTAVTYIEATLSCLYQSANRIVTITNGFLMLTSYPASKISLKIPGLINPSIALTTSSFSIETKDSNGASIDYIGAGVTYTKACNSPCLTCSGDLSYCITCDLTSIYPYLYSSTCVSTCPSGYYLDADKTCKLCTSPCKTCVDSGNKCLSCITSPYKVLYGSSCVSSCPQFYQDKNQKCVLITDSLIPFIFLIIWVIFIILLIFLKIMKSLTLVFSTLLCFNSILLLVLWILVDSYLFAEAFTITGVVYIIPIIILFGINIVWQLTVYTPFIRRKDAFYFKWRQAYPITEIIIQIFSYVFCFQCFRMSVCRFFSFGHFSAALHKERKISRILNIFTIIYIVLVCLYVIALNIYSIFILKLSDDALYHNIESWIITSVHVAMLITEIATKNRINRYDTFMLKSTYEETRDQIRRNKFLFLNKADAIIEALFEHINYSKEEKNVKSMMYKFRYSELPSPTNELNLVKYQFTSKKGAKESLSYPSSPRTRNAAFQRIRNNKDEENISVHDEKEGFIIQQRIESVDHMSSRNAYDSDSEVSRRTVKRSHKVNMNDYSSPFVLPNNHLKLTKLKREINSYKNKSEKIAEENKLKAKEKKRLEEKVRLLNDEINELLNGNNHTDATDSERVSIGYTEQKGIKATSTSQDWNQEDGKQVLDEVLKGSMTSAAVDSDGWHKLQDRKCNTVTSMKPLMLDKFDDHSLENRDVILQKVGSSYSKLRTPLNADIQSNTKDKPLNFYGVRKSSVSPSDMGRTSIENNDIFGDLLPSTMEAYNPLDFKIKKGERDLNYELPDINKRRDEQFFAFDYRPHAKYFGSENQEGNFTKRSGSKKRGGIPKPIKHRNEGIKTARASTPSEFPHIRGTPRNIQSNRRGSNASIFFKKHDLNITNDDDLERAYKNFLPGEMEMLKDDIEFRNVRGSRSNGRATSRKGHNTSKKRNNHNKVLQDRLNMSRSMSSKRRSIEPSEANQRLTPMERRKKWRKANKKLKKNNKKNKQKASHKRESDRDEDYSNEGF